MKFRYKKYSNGFIRPIIPIKIKSGAQSVTYEVLVDSGADICIFDAEIGDALGVNVESGDEYPVVGIAGQAATYYVHSVKIEVGGHTYKIEAGFLRNVSGGNNYGVVGQKGFFENFVVKFDFQKEEVDLKQRN